MANTEETALDLTESQLSALKAVASCRSVWPLETELPAKIGPGAVDELAGLGLVERWRRPDGVSVVLTTRGVATLGVVAEEFWRYHSVARKVRGEPGKKPRKVRVAAGVPRWIKGEPDEDGNVDQPKCLVELGAGLVEREKPVTPPIRAEEAAPEFLEYKPPTPKKSSTEYVADWTEGETTRDPGQALRLFASDGATGIPVEVETRKRSRPVEAARRAMKAAKGKKRKGAQS